MLNYDDMLIYSNGCVLGVNYSLNSPSNLLRSPDDLILIDGARLGVVFRLPLRRLCSFLGHWELWSIVYYLLGAIFFRLQALLY